MLRDSEPSDQMQKNEQDLIDEILPAPPPDIPLYPLALGHILASAINYEAAVKLVWFIATRKMVSTN